MTAFPLLLAWLETLGLLFLAALVVVVARWLLNR